MRICHTSWSGKNYVGEARRRASEASRQQSCTVWRSCSERHPYVPLGADGGESLMARGGDDLDVRKAKDGLGVSVSSCLYSSRVTIG